MSGREEGRLQVVIVGGGIAGLTCAITLARCRDIKVTVLEKNVRIENPDDGIQLPPNACHALASLGLLDQFKDIGIEAQRCRWLDFQTENSDELLKKDLWDYKYEYDAPWLFIHRKSAISILLAEAERLRIDIRSNAIVEEVNPQVPYVKLTNGEIYTAHLIIGADGINSTVRSHAWPDHEPTKLRGIAYRATADCSTSDTEHALGEHGVCRMWLGPKMSVVMHPIRGGEQLDIKVIVNDEALVGEIGSHDPRRALSKKFDAEGWNAVVEMVLRRAPRLTKERIKYLKPLKHWSTGGCVTLVGDAAHSSLPFLFQREAMAIEDSMTLGVLLGLLVNQRPKGWLPKQVYSLVGYMLDAYEALRYPRTKEVMDAARETEAWVTHKPDRNGKRRDSGYAVRRERQREEGDFYKWLYKFNVELKAGAEFTKLEDQGLYRWVR